MKVSLTQLQRVFVAIIYLIVLIILFTIIDGNYNELLWKTSNDKRIWFFSGALLIILGKYVAEPFFSKPTDAITNSAAIIITLLTINDKEKFVFYEIILVISLLVLFFSLTTIFLKSFSGETIDKINKFSYDFSTKIGNSSFLFSLIYVPAIYSYFIKTDNPDIAGFVVLLAFWICIVFFDVIGKFVELFAVLFKKKEINEEELGQAIGCENPMLYQVEIDYLKHKSTNTTIGDLVTIENQKLSKSIGLIINKKQLLNKLWLEIYLLTDENETILKLPQNHRLQYDNVKTTLKSLNTVNKVKSIESFPQNLRDKVLASSLYSQKEEFVGYIEKGSNINQIVFQHLGDNKISEGGIVYTTIYGEETLYQLIDGQTREEPLEYKDGYGYEVAYARKLGYYNDEKNELNTRKWMPKIYTPVFLFENEAIQEEKLIDIAEMAIGRLPETSLKIPIMDYNSLVTHNTAILGILGIGKSRLTFELLKKLIYNSLVKIICIDVTNQYEKELSSYFEESNIVVDIEAAERLDLKNNNLTGVRDNPQTWGNEALYKVKLDKCISDFYGNDDARILILNPDWHNVSIAGSNFNITHKNDLSVAQKTRIISERAFKYSYEQGETMEAKCLLVYEEAHSLIPEWNSVANDGDKTAVNGTAKVILQGRKYGLGSLVITQRTANISKSILNQCNTIFALRVFDDTGKQFLENYIGSDYSNTLPTLEERHAIAVGKALKLKQPVIIQLNDMKYHIIENEEQEISNHEEE
ncbi:ATP-binding protein [Flavivirga spongiicola]|uniref:DUF87 domain-containing protein n=1 Tax=Flavivirga spongiicola TaxID=421621 RepID=A0ABU7XYP5_9FLAO|nr:DUF87 domain-containing protein [Flavivirga sp. MEBiC05379]MDO5980902.1 DUF87 domain-containing protein [Flavivirga sp. MEBiC05379]